MGQGGFLDTEAGTERTLKTLAEFIGWLTALVAAKFTGRIVLNMSQGAIGSVEKTEKVK